MANQIFAANVNAINEIALPVAAAFRFGCFRVTQAIADPSDNTKTIVDIQIKEGVVYRFGLNISLTDLATAMGADQVSKTVNVSVAKLDGIPLSPARLTKMQTSAFVYATANPMDNAQSIMMWQAELAATTQKLIVNHTLAQLSTLFN